jgi:hypothetical protein
VPSRILLFLGVQAVVAVPAIFTRERWLRVILVGVLLAISISVGVIMPGIEVRSVMGQIRAVDPVTPVTLDNLRKILVDVRFRITAIQVVPCFWLAVLAVVQVRRRADPPGSASKMSQPFDPNGAV